MPCSEKESFSANFRLKSYHFHVSRKETLVFIYIYHKTTSTVYNLFQLHLKNIFKLLYLGVILLMTDLFVVHTSEFEYTVVTKAYVL